MTDCNNLNKSNKDILEMKIERNQHNLSYCSTTTTVVQVTFVAT